MTTLDISAEPVLLDDLRAAFAGPVTVSLSDAVWERVVAGERVISDAIAAGAVIYAVNTGFGKLADRRISADDLEELQRRLIASHMVGVGEPLSDDIVRATMLLKVVCLGQGYSGVRRVLVEQMLAMLNADVLPVVPGQGSVGASGDLAPLSHLAAALTGIGRVRIAGVEMDAAEGLARCGVAPIVLGPKEGVALINGTQVSTALALYGLFAAESVLNASVAAGALSLQAVAGRPVALDDRIHRIRRQVGQLDVATALRTLVADSAILATEFEGRRMQDPYCMRCMPQVIGAALDLLVFAGTVLQREANAVSDNPLVFAEDGEVLSGGNFHGQPVAYAADIIALALCEVGSISERRTAMLMDTTMSGLPPFLMPEAGLNSGFLMAQVTSAALVAENRALSHPASVDSIPTSAGQEDHVSMATHAGRRLRLMAANVSYIVGIELMAGAQGAHLRGADGLSPATAPVYELVRSWSPYLDQDRALAGEMETVAGHVRAGVFTDQVGLAVGPMVGAL